MTDGFRVTVIILLILAAPFILWAAYNVLLGLAVLFVMFLQVLFAIATAIF